MDDARQEYTRRLADRRAAAVRLGRREAALSWARLAIFAAGLLLVWPVLFGGTLVWGWLAVPVLAFAAVALVHDRVIRGRVRASLAVAHYERSLERLDGRWAGRGHAGAALLDPDHPYARDLDLYGPGSLFELLSAARTRSGERTLSRWLEAPADPAEVRRRQAAVEELRGRLDLREALAVLGEQVGPVVDPEHLVAWAAAMPLAASPGLAWVAAFLGLANVALLAHWLTLSLGTGPPEPARVWLGGIGLALSWAASGWLALGHRGAVRRVLGGVERPERELELLASLLDRIERERFTSPLLAELRRALDENGQPPSRRIARLARLTEIADSRRNMLFAPLAALMLVGTQLALAMERWRARSGPAVARWLEAVGRLEALVSLAAHAYEHPEDPFPEILETGPCFEGRGLGHPLLPAERCVSNDLVLGDDLRLLVVSGSNMSGKSTLLRTVGVNAALALAGAPVRARSLRLSPLTIAACMRVEDSLQEGMSRFYAEIVRLRRIVDLTGGERPVLFLLDEILHGTNSHDRRIGAAALVRGLIDRGAVGLVTTHDLALARIAEELAPRAANVHFEDRLEDGRLVFDYRLRAGVVERSNALELMRAVGLDV